jgi:ATP-binding cassette subfamily B protein
LTVKAYGVEGKTTQKTQDLADTYFDKRLKRNNVHALMSLIYGFLSNFGLIFAVVWCSVSVLYGRNTDYGSIVSVILLLMQLQHPFSAFSSVIPAYYARLASGERLQEIDALPRELSAENGQIDIPAIYEDMQYISMQDITFGYGEELVFNQALAVFEKGSILCLTGASGAGKSTVFKLLLNVYKPKNGQMTIVGTEHKTSLTSQYRGMFAYVPQGNFLFSGTIYENLTFFSDCVDKESLMEKVKNALQIACAEFVWDLPQGLQTPLYEGGEGLSEGQLQRLAVARAVLSDRPILLLDEATSALDGDTERRLLENIKALRNKTCLIVTHRPAALDIADGVINVEKGKMEYVEKTRE